MIGSHENVDSSGIDLQLNVSAETISTQSLSISSSTFIERMIELLQSRSNKEESVNKRIAFKWSFDCKEIALLLRKACLDLLKSEFYGYDKIKSETDLAKYRSDLANVILSALQDLRSAYNDCYTENIEILDEWAYQIDPTEVIIEQLHAIIDQIKKIRRSEFKLETIQSKLENFKALYLMYMSQRSVSITKIKQLLDDLYIEGTALEDQLAIRDIQKLAGVLDKNIEILDTRPLMSSYDGIRLGEIDRLNLPVDIDGSKLEIKSIDVLSELSSWVSFNLANKLRDADRSIITFYEQTSISLFQLSNRLKAKAIDHTEDILIDTKDYIKPLEKLITQVEKLSNDVNNTAFANINEELKKYLTISQMFDKKENFLPQSNISPVNALSSSTSIADRYSREQLYKWWKYGKSWLFGDNTHRYPEDTTDFVRYMTQFNPVSDTNTLFMRKGFLGASFTIARRGLEQDMGKHYVKWREGYGGGLLIKGPAGSGKSNVIGKLQLMVDDFPVYNIVPNQSIDVQGHKFLVNNDLCDALKAIIKYQNVSKSIVIIDHLDTHIDNPEQGYDVMQELFNIISKNCHRIYFVVACNDRLFNKMNVFLDVENVFTKIINTNSMANEVIQEALVTRALAVANHEDLSYDTDALYKKAKEVSSFAKGIIGYAMQLWCIMHESHLDYGVPTAFRKSILRHRYLLQMLLCFGPINTNKIVKMFDDRDQQKIRSDISYLLQNKIINRPKEGCIAISDLLKLPVDQILSN